MTKWRLLPMLAAILAVLANAMPVAAMPGPDSTPTIESIAAYRNLLETGDALYIILANIPYANTTGTDPVTSAFIWRFIDTDGVTELGSTTGSVYIDNGYNWNVYSFYFPASTGIAWGEDNYTIKLSENPAVFPSPTTTYYDTSLTEYSSAVTTIDSRTELSAYILTLAAQLDLKWSLGVEYSLLAAPAGAGTRLSNQGEGFFYRAIPGLQSMAPESYQVVMRDITLGNRTWGTSYADALMTQYNGTWVDTAKAAGATLFKTDVDIVSIFLVIVLCFGVFFGNLAVTSQTFDGFADAAFILIVCARAGMYGLGFLILLAALAFVYIGVKIWRPF